MATSLINPNQDFALWAVLLSAATIGFWAERTPWGAKLSGAVVTILVTFILSNLRIIPPDAPAYGVVWSYLVPLAIPLLLFQADLFRIVREAGPTLIAYGIGAVGTILGTVVAYYLIPLGEEGWKLAAIFCATYIGGSVNFAATAESTGLRAGDLLSAGVAADNLVMTLYFLVLFSLPSIKWLRGIFPNQRSHENTHSSQFSIFDSQSRQQLSVFKISLALAISMIACAVGYGLASWLGFNKGGILVVTVLIVMLATVFPSYLSRITAAEKIGYLLMQVFFAVIGASANVEIVLRVGSVLFIFAGLILAIHLLVLLGVGRLLGLDLAELVIASNANMGGPTTAAAMATARQWDKLVTPAILCGTLGYAVATFIGVGLGNFLRSLG
ncbi:DUF819 family protein [Moorena sp. SIO3I6]|uniref:DUF819 family protein n=1 Tax=Moorena sp. SIO3I6 TaxID=2607831 RepID=UPI0013FC4B53|nr:DUF819 family protein [Moorena sp. SIO3I6]NEO44572.1 DUF819 family protein [Moorena sp. SIO4A3]NEP26501.1 DUF819 family protein [Moorena sp. SIO3I6]